MVIFTRTSTDLDLVFEMKSIGRSDAIRKVLEALDTIEKMAY